MGVTACVSPTGAHGSTHPADHGASAAKNQQDSDRDEPAVSPHCECQRSHGHRDD
jgi:hypothetical protein